MHMHLCMHMLRQEAFTKAHRWMQLLDSVELGLQRSVGEQVRLPPSSHRTNPPQQPPHQPTAAVTAPTQPAATSAT